MVREIEFYKNHFINFYVSLDHKVQSKFDYAFKLIRTVDRVPEKFLKHIENSNGLYEIRVKYRSDIYRVFCCFDEGRIVVLFNGFQKKTQKTPKKELVKASELKKQYFISKKETK